MWNDGHSGWRTARARRGAGPGVLAALLLLAALACPAARAAAARSPANAPRVVWAGEGRVYVAAPESGAVAPRMLVRVFDRGREIAAGEVTHVLDGALASVRLASGRVEADERLDRLEVVLEPAPVRPLATLRVGLPASSRRALLPPCDEARLDASALPRAYRTEPLADGGFRLIADDTVATATAWPETLFVRHFADRADEEIALERGDLDVAVFWPGEPSARLRERAPGIELLRGARDRGAIVARSADADSAIVTAALPNLAALNAELFAGDLLPWGERRADAGDAGAGAVAGNAGWPIRYSVGDLPGAHAMSRFLNRNMGGARVSFGTVLAAYRDLPVAAPGPPDAGGLRPGEAALFALRCPVLCSAARAGDVRELGAGRFANLLDCAATRKRP